MTTSRIALYAILAALPLAACGGGDSSKNEADTATEQTPEGGVVRNEVASPEEPPVQSMPALAVIQSQPGPDGSQVDLLKVAVTGDILTVTMRCSSTEKINGQTFRVSDISVIDDATSQRIGVLRDNAGNALVSNFNNSSGIDNDYLRADCEVKPGVIWAKFPAPPATSKTVSINFPDVAPFDGIPVTR